jgi:hypothetical protein
MTMKGKKKAAMALGVGYFLGRHPKFRAMTAKAATKAVGVTNSVVRKGVKLLRRSN